uniref:Uncharacterized protein n=1 Tax=Anguilla anguilla TaxID=7936 RepID=A0A0E9U0F7_ANGAN
MAGGLAAFHLKRIRRHAKSGVNTITLVWQEVILCSE